MMNKRLHAGVVSAVLALLLSACATSGQATGGDGGKGRLRVVATFYPLQWVAERVGGKAVTVENLVRPGTEPHDLELTPRQVGDVKTAGLVVYLSGFQPAVDQAVANEAAGRTLDVRSSARLDLDYVPLDAPAHAATDPHFWLDPTRLADVATAVAGRLEQVAPGRRDEIATNLASLRAELQKLDAELRGGLARCANKQLVTSHNAFGYFARRYGFEQVGISGLSPDSEPRPGELASIARLVRERGVRTIYTESLASPALAETVARETGATTAMLDPLEGLTSESAGDDYLQVMRVNLETLRKGQSCP